MQRKHQQSSPKLKKNRDYKGSIFDKQVNACVVILWYIISLRSRILQMIIGLEQKNWSLIEYVKLGPQTM